MNHMKHVLSLLLFLLASCGGGGDTAEPAKPQQHSGPKLFGWWGAAQGNVSQGYGFDFLAEAPGNLAIVAPYDPADAKYLCDKAESLGQKCMVIVWTQAWEGGSLADGWRARVEAVVKATPNAIGYYLRDESGLHGDSPNEIEQVANALPKDRYVMMSLSAPELDGSVKVHIPQAVNLLGANLYAVAGVADPKPYLDKLASYGKPMYLNLSAYQPMLDPGMHCAGVTLEGQKSELALNDKIIAWGKDKDIRAYVAFLYQTEMSPWQNICGAQHMPLMLDYMMKLAETVR